MLQVAIFAKSFIDLNIFIKLKAIPETENKSKRPILSISPKLPKKNLPASFNVFPGWR